MGSSRDRARLSSGNDPLTDPVGVLLHHEEVPIGSEGQALRGAHLSERGPGAPEGAHQGSAPRVLPDVIARGECDVQVAGVARDAECTGGGADVELRQFRARGRSSRQIIDKSGGSQAAVINGSDVTGGGPKSLFNPENVAFGPNGKLYIADTYNDRILVYTV